MNLLVNLPPSFFTEPAIQDLFHRLEKLGTVRKTSHNTQDEIRADLAWADYVIMWAWPLLDEGMLAEAPQLRHIGFLDVIQPGARAAISRGLPISNSRGGFSPAVAEMALTLILSSLRRTSDYHAKMKVGSEPWVGDFPGEIDPLERELTGAKVGLIGLGGVGRRLAELLGPFQCDLRVVDPFVAEGVVAAAGARRMELDDMLASSDIVVLCAASNDGTQKLIGADRIALLPANAIFINVARAALVDTDALVTRLHKGDLIACLDVFDIEPLPSEHPLRSCPNTFLTPHRAGGLKASVRRIVERLVDDLENHAAGRPLAWQVTEGIIPSLDA
jgi:phosphoglycerate dehydrogenase-like enzyme